MKGLDSISGKMNSWGKSFLTIGGAVAGIGVSITGAMVGAIAQFSEAGSSLSDMAEKTGVAASALAELKFAAEQSGTTIDAVVQSLVAMSKKGLDPKNFDAYAAEIAALPKGLSQITRAMEVWGKSGAELIPMLGELKALRKEAHDLGLVPTDEAVAAAAKLGDTWDKVGSTVRASIFEIGAALASVAQPALEAVVRATAGIAKWLRHHQEIAKTVAVIGAGLIVVGTVIGSIGVALIKVGAVITAFKAVVGLGPVLAAALSPAGSLLIAVVAIGAAIIAGTVYWLRFTESGQKAAYAIKVGFQKAFGDIEDSINRIIDALLAADFSLAAGIAAKKMELAFFKSIDAIVEKIEDNRWLNPKVFGKKGDSVLRGLTKEDVARAELELSILEGLARRKGEAARVDPGNEGQYGSSGIAESMKSLGSFNPYAITLQNYGKGDDVQKRQEDVLKKIADQMFPRLIKAVEDSSTKWSQ